jgi:hypothetical protein
MWASGSEFPIADDSDRRWVPIDLADIELRMLSQMAARQQPLIMDMESCGLSPTGRHNPIVVCAGGGKTWALKVANELRGREMGPIIIDEGHHVINGELRDVWLEYDFKQCWSPRPLTAEELAPPVNGQRQKPGVHHGPQRGDNHNHNLPDAALAAEVPNRKQRRALNAKRRSKF